MEFTERRAHQGQGGNSYDYKDSAELLNLDSVKTWNKSINGLEFWRYSQAENGPTQYLLMGEWKSDNKHSWWPIGYITEDAGLPKFEPTKGVGDAQRN